MQSTSKACSIRLQTDALRMLICWRLRDWGLSLLHDSANTEMRIIISLPEVRASLHIGDSCSKIFLHLMQIKQHLIQKDRTKLYPLLLKMHSALFKHKKDFHIDAVGYNCYLLMEASCRVMCAGEQLSLVESPSPNHTVSNLGWKNTGWMVIA